MLCPPPAVEACPVAALSRPPEVVAERPVAWFSAPPPTEVVRAFKQYLRVKDLDLLQKEWYDYIESSKFK